MRLYTFVYAFGLLILSVAASAQDYYYGRRYRSWETYPPVRKKWIKRQYISLGVPFMNMEFSSKYQEHPYQGNSIDTAIYFNKSSNSSYTFSVGSFANLARFNETQMLALDISWGVHLYQFKLADITNDYGEVETLRAATMLYEMPLSLQYKSGGEVSLNPKKHKMLFSVGAGFAPTVAFTVFYISTDATADVTAKIRSFLVAEMGLHFGVALKVRAVYYLSPMPLMEKISGDLQDGKTSLTVTGSNNFVLTLSILPFSWKWGREEPYRFR